MNMVWQVFIGGDGGISTHCGDAVRSSGQNCVGGLFDTSVAREISVAPEGPWGGSEGN